MERFLKESENVINLIRDSSFSSDINVSFLSSCHDLTITNDVTSHDISTLPGELDQHEEDGRDAAELNTGSISRKDLWRLTSLTVHDLSFQDHDISCNLDISGLQWESPVRGQWHGVNQSEARTRHWSESDYGSLETDSDGEVDTEHESNLTCGTFDPEDDIMDQSLLWDTEVVS